MLSAWTNPVMQYSVDALEKSRTIGWMSMVHLPTGNANGQWWRWWRWWTWRARRTRWWIWVCGITVDQVSPVARSYTTIEKKSDRTNTFGTETENTFEVALANVGMREIHVAIVAAQGAIDGSGLCTLLGVRIIVASRIAMLNVCTTLEACNVLVARYWAGRQCQLIESRSKASLELECLARGNQCANQSCVKRCKLNE